MRRPPRVLLVCLITAACLATCYVFVLKPLVTAMHNIPTGADAEQSSSLARFVVSRVAFDSKSVTDPDRPPLYWHPRRNSARLDVYGLTNAARQAEVLSAMIEWQTTNRNMSRLSVRFYERENWRQFTNEQGGYSGGDRLPEVLLREISIVSSNLQPNKYAR